MPRASKEDGIEVFDPFSVLLVSDTNSFMYASLTPPRTSGDGSSCATIGRVLYIGRNYSLLDRPLDGYTDFGL